MANYEPRRRTLLADLLTPVALYDRLARGPYSYLLESVEGGERWARYSIIGLPAREVIRVRDGHLTIHRDGQLAHEEQLTDPLAWLAEFHGQFVQGALDLQLPFAGGLVGYFGYDCVGYMEKRLAQRPAQDPLQLPDLLFLVSLDLAILDNLRGEVHLISHCRTGESKAEVQGRLDQMEAALNNLGHARPRSLNWAGQLPPLTEHFPEADFKAAVEKIKEYLAAGDSMQVVPSQRRSCAFHQAPLDYYRALRLTNPSPYMYLLDLGDFQLVGSSPEILTRQQGRQVTLRPIAGTRPRGATTAEDLALEKELLADEKEIAEHAMLIDLARNDISRVCEVGSVHITEKMVIERYSHVMHIVSNVEGTLRPEVGAMDLLRATFPAGTLAGAPKIRAMEIIDEVEPERRGVYGGAIGYWSFSGNMDLAIAIRTAVIKGGRLYAQAGAGVVYDSQPASEWQETVNKSAALLRALALLQ